MTDEEIGTFARKAAISVESIGSRLIDAGLRRDDSLLTEGESVWTVDHLDELIADYVEKPDVGDGGFFTKLKKQLAGSSAEAIQLFAELLILQSLPITNLGGEQKIAQVARVLEIGSLPIALPEEVREALMSGGVFNGGQAFTTYRWAQMAYLIEFARYFKSLPVERRIEALKEPLAFRDEVKAVKTGQAAQQQSLLYLAFPRFYLPVVAESHRRAIRDGFADEYLAGSIGDLDEDIAAIYKAMTAAEGDHVDLYASPWIGRWQKREQPDAVSTPAPPKGGKSVPAAVHLPDATPELAARLHASRGWLQECVELLRHRRQLIFYGPPGTGKTYLAQELAWHVADQANVKLVQFHPAYSYEDFFEGFRPKGSDNGQIGFELKPGPLRLLVDNAADNPNAAYVLIIDEINRGNLPKIFGELYFLLEYRDQAIDLMYSADSAGPFSLPKNIFVIGTMNTADRSIALVDAALRRRFAFLPLHPSEEPTSGILRSWLKSKGRPSYLADLHDALNARIIDPEFKIGPSYFIRDILLDDPNEQALRLMWRTDILPLLEEHHYGDRNVNVLAQYGLDAMKTNLAAKAAALADALDVAATDDDARTDSPR